MAMLGGSCSKCCTKDGLKCYVPANTHGACCKLDGTCSIEAECDCDTEAGEVFNVGETCEACTQEICCQPYGIAVENYWWDVVRNASWQPSFRLLSPELDSDVDQPTVVGGSDGRRIVWANNSSYLVPDRIRVTNPVSFLVRVGIDSIYKHLIIQVGGCSTYFISFFHPEIGTTHGPIKLSHIDTSGNETNFQLANGALQTFVGFLDSDKPSPFFTGTYLAEFADGKTGSIQFRSNYQLVRVLKC